MSQNQNEPRKVSFSDFVFLQSQQALLSMGQLPNPMTGKYEENLPIAEYVIDILAMLEGKTKGNLDENESKLIENLLHELRMTYIEKVRQAEMKAAAAPKDTDEAKPKTKAPKGAKPGEEKPQEASEPDANGGKRLSAFDASSPSDSDSKTKENVIQMPPPPDEENGEKPGKGD